MAAGHKILVVDDNLLLLKLVQLHLKNLGYQTESASTGEEALSKIQAESFDLAILDVNLPGIDGFTTAQRIRNLGKLLPIVFLSADDLEQHQAQFDAGVNSDYLDKFYSIDELKNILAKWLTE